MSHSLQALPGFYKLLFLYIEPFSAVLPAPMIWFFPGATWFHYEQVPSLEPLSPSVVLDPRTVIALYHLANCYLLVGLIVSMVFRVIGRVCRDNPIVQEQIIGTILAAMAITDVLHILLTFVGLPSDLRLNIPSWNGITHGNITFTSFLFCMRMAWFAGIGRQRFHSQATFDPSSERKYR